MPERPISPLALLALCVPLVACSGGKGNLTDITTEGPTTGATSDPSESESVSVSSSTADVTTGTGTTTSGTGTTGTTTSDPSTGSTTDPGTSGTSGGPLVCDAPNFFCSEPLDCENGDCDLIFDEDGCLRPHCQTNADCDEDELCLSGEAIGQCLSSGYECHDDEQGQCQCGGDADCGGALCFPDDWPIEGAPYPVGYVIDSCSEDDSPAFEFRFSLNHPLCVHPFPFGEGPWLRILYVPGMGWEPLPPGDYDLAGLGFAQIKMGNEQSLTTEQGTFTIDSWANGLVSGSYALDFDGMPAVVGDFGVPDEIQYCEVQAGCG